MMENTNKAGATEVFEIHITGDQSILKNGTELGLKTIEIDLLRPDQTVLRTEYMTSCVEKFPDFEACYDWIKEKIAKLKSMGTTIIREKIECPCYDHYMNSAIYVESHEKVEPISAGHNLPISRNRKKTSLLTTDRVYKRSQFKPFIEQYQKGLAIIEFCLYDTYIGEDKDWFSCFNFGE